MSYSTWTDFAYYEVGDIATYQNIAYVALLANRDVVPTTLAPNWDILPAASGAPPSVIYNQNVISYTFNNTPYEDILRFSTYPFKTFPSGTTAVRLTYSINVKSGLPNSEYLLVYGGLVSSAAVITQGIVFNSTNPYTIDILPNGSGTFSGTITIVDYVILPSTGVSYTPILYGRVGSGTHSSDVYITVSAESVR